ncbi:MAG TPA: NYN domain-containing protein [Candidatus Binatia bacterium]|nr:NYN domain-containing protein [Candidatus Binatia bacterium]
MASKRIWVLDGHNLIFAIPTLRSLQKDGRGEEARDGLAGALERFAHERQEQVLIVFDSHDPSPGPAAIRRPLLEIVFARGGAGAADIRILQEANRLLERGHPVTVVTDDVRTLAGRLPRGVHHLVVAEFWLKHIEKEAGEGGKRIEGDYSDVEREMVRAALAEPLPEPRRPVLPPGTGGPEDARARAAEALSSQVQRKREKGRLRQERRLKRRTRH